MNISINKAVSTGWGIVTKNLGFFVVFMLLVMVTYSVPQIIQAIVEKSVPTLAFVLGFAAVFVEVLVQLNFIRVALKFLDNKKAVYKDLFNTQLFLPFFMGWLVYVIIVGAGTLLLILPGIYLAIKLQFWAYLVIDKNMNPFDALKKSWDMTRGKFWKLFGLIIVLCAINLLGVLVLLVGLFITIPLTFVAMASIYRQLSK